MRGTMAGKRRYGAMLLALLCMAAACGAPALAAQEPVFRLDMGSLNLQKGVSGSLVVSMIDAQGARVVGIDGLDQFDVLSQSQSTYTSIVNNVTTFQEDVYFTIMPRATGRFTLKATVSYNGQSYETNALEVTVTDGPSGAGGATPDVFVKTNISHTEAYLGEKVLLTYVLYSRESIDSVGFTEYIALDGAVVKEMQGDQIKTESVYLDGIRYTAYEIKQIVVDPIKAGVCAIPAFNLQVNVLSDAGFGGFGGLVRTTAARYVQTEALELLVKPLPAEGRPDNFSGIVGELSLSGQYSRDAVNYGESVALRMEASGNCNLDGLKSLVGDGISGFTVYETQKNTVESVEGNQYRVQKNFEAILMPETTGESTVPSIFVSYFSPLTGNYETAEIPGTTLTVHGEMPAASVFGAASGGSVETVRVSQVNYAQPSDGYVTLRLREGLLYAVLIGAALFVALACLAGRLVSHAKKRDATLQSLYRQLTGAKDVQEAYNLLNAMLKHCYQLNIKASTREAVRSGLADADLAARVTEIMAYMESAEVENEKWCKLIKEKVREVYASKFKKARRMK